VTHAVRRLVADRHERLLGGTTVSPRPCVVLALELDVAPASGRGFRVLRARACVHTDTAAWSQQEGNARGQCCLPPGLTTRTSRRREGRAQLANVQWRSPLPRFAGRSHLPRTGTQREESGEVVRTHATPLSLLTHRMRTRQRQKRRNEKRTKTPTTFLSR
jgi:hypothetical protein